MELVAQVKSGGVLPIEGDHADRTAEAGGADGLVQGRHCPRSRPRRRRRDCRSVLDSPVAADNPRRARGLGSAPAGEPPDRQTGVAFAANGSRATSAPNSRASSRRLARGSTAMTGRRRPPRQLHGDQPDGSQPEDRDAVAELDRRRASPAPSRPGRDRRPPRPKALPAEIDVGLVDGLRLPDREVTEDAVAEGEARHPRPDLR